MHVVLLTPPIANPFYPPLGLPSLAAFLRKNSQHSCAIYDLSLETLLHLLSRRAIEEASARLDVRINELARGAVLAVEDQPEYFRVARALTKVRATLADLESSIGLFHEPGAFLDPVRRRRAIHVIDDGMEIVSAAHYPYSINRSEFMCGEAPFSLAAVIEGVAQGHSPAADFLETRLDELLATEQPAVVGISICYFGQLIAGLELARHIRRVRPDIILVAGGSLMPEVGAIVANEPSLATLFDHVICYEGETALAALLDAIEAGRGDFGGVPNRICGTAGRVELRHREDMTTLPTPDFAGFDLERYLSPHPILPLLTSRGCYWGACAFCTHFHTYGDDYRTLRGDQIVNQIDELRARFGCENFYFVDESLAPSKARAIARVLLDRGLSINWATEIRFERALDDATLGLMAQSGCRALSFGLESGSQRVLDLMKKGIEVVDIDRVLRRCEDVGIASHVMCIVGFPGETAAEVQETVDLLDRHRDRLALVGFSPFTLNTNSIVHRDPDAYGVAVLDTADVLRPDRNFMVRSGLGQMEAYELYDAVANSELVRAIDAATALATREHLLLVVSMPRPPDPHVPNGLHVEHRILPFSLHEAQRAHDNARHEKQSRLLGTDAGRPLAEPLPLTDNHILHIPEAGRIIEVDEDALDMLQRLARGDVSFADPQCFELLGGLIGDRSATGVRECIDA